MSKTDLGLADFTTEALAADLDKKIPVQPDGPEPVSGQRALPSSANVTGRILSTPLGARKQRDRSIGDEFALLVAFLNSKGAKFPLDIADLSWPKVKDGGVLQPAIARLALGRWNAYQCAAGKGHCPQPNAIQKIGSAIAKIPVLGPVLKAAASPITIVSNLAQGERIDHALLGAMKEQLGAIKSVAPYVAAVVSFVPGIGTGVAAALSAGAALAEGKTITQALEEGIKGAIPGGTIAAAGFDLAKKVASGQNVAKAALDTARASLPPAAQKAFDIGVAVTTGKQLQDSLNSAIANITPAETKQLLDTGAQAIQTTPGLADLAKSLPSDAARQGAQLAAGAIAHQGVNEAQLRAMRAKLTGDTLTGFDAVLQSQGFGGAAEDLVAVTHAGALSPEEQQKYRDAAAASSKPAAPIATPKPHEPPKAPLATPKPHEVTRAVSPVAATAPATAPAAAATAPPAAVAIPSTPAYPPYPFPKPAGAVSGVPMYPHAHMPVHSRPQLHTNHGGRAYAPATVVIATPAGGTCRQWSEPIEMDSAMQWAARSAVNGSHGAPRMVQGPDGTNYLFAIENGVLTARACIA